MKEKGVSLPQALRYVHTTVSLETLICFLEKKINKQPDYNYIRTSVLVPTARGYSNPASLICATFD